MYARWSTFWVASFGLILGACTNQLISAEPLAVTAADMAAAETSGAKRAFLGRVVYDSEAKCTSFVNTLVGTQGSVNTIGDIVAGTLSGVGAFSPASRVLSGTASIVTGAKSAINSDFYAKASIENFETAIQQSYFKNIGQYSAALESQNETNLIVAVEVDKIQTIHASCGLAPAEAAIQATIAPQGGAPGGVNPGTGGAAGPPPHAAAGPAAAELQLTPHVSPSGVPTSGMVPGLALR